MQSLTSVDTLYRRINKPGGCAKITQVHFARNGVQVESIDVKYVLGGGFEREIDPAIVSPFEMLERGGRKRRGREFLMEQADTVVKKVKQAMATTNQAGATKKGSKQQPANKKKKKKTILNRMTTPARQPDQSTSPSTPVTPEHPTASKPKTALKASSSKTETGVPAYVYTHASSVETSPLEDHVNWAFTDTKKTTIARRGLFGTAKIQGASTPLAKENAKDNFADQSGSSSLVRSREESSRSMNSPNAPAAQNVLHLKGTIPHAHSVGDSSVDDNHKTAQDVRKAHSAAVKQSLSKKNKPFVAKKAPLSDRKPTAKETSATLKKTASLKNVFDNELRKARQFLDQMCQAPAQEIQDDPVNPHAEESRLDTSGSEKEGDDDVKKPAAV